MHVNSVIPEARGAAARIMQESEGYRDATITLATGEADRFTLLRKEYQLAPAITRKRLYLQTMESVFSRSKKVLLDVDSSSNILYLPLGQAGGDQSAANRLAPIIGTDRSADGISSPGRTSNRESRR